MNCRNPVQRKMPSLQTALPPELANNVIRVSIKIPLLELLMALLCVFVYAFSFPLYFMDVASADKIQGRVQF